MPLPVWDTCFKAYWYLLRHVWTYLGQFALLLAALLALRYALGAISAVGGGGSELISGAIEGLMVLLALLAIVSICVRCHRAILLDETPRLFDPFRFGVRDLRYLGIWLATFVALVAPTVALAQVLMPSGSSHWPIFIFFLAWAAFVGPLFALAFPAVGIDRPQALRSAVRLSRGHRLRILGVLIVVHLPLIAMGVPFAFFGSVFGDTISRIVQTLLQLASNLAMVAVTSVAYATISGGTASNSDAAAVFD